MRGRRKGKRDLRLHVHWLSVLSWESSFYCVSRNQFLSTDFWALPEQVHSVISKASALGCWHSLLRILELELPTALP